MPTQILTATPMLAADYRVIGITTAALVLVAFVLVFIRNIVAARPELGSEMELAANRKPYYSDEELEGTKLDRSLSFALVMLGLVALSLPFYWLAEPGRQDGAVDAYNLSFEVQGEGLYLNGAQCVNCHAAGGAGGQAPYVLQDADGQFVANATWKAPALNDVLLRYSEDEVRYILNYGRPGSPMAAWGTPGGGPLTWQQVDNIIVYLRTLQVQSLDPIAIDQAGDDEAVAAAQALADEQVEAIRAEVDRSIEAGEFETVGEAVFNLGLFSGFQGGSLSCARCHTAGWSLGTGVSPHVLDDGVAGCGGGDPSGIGFSLCGTSMEEKFPDDWWKGADGSWLPAQGLSGDGYFYIEAADGSEIRLNDTGVPVTDDQVPYFVLDEKADQPIGGSEPGAGELAGDLAACDYVSQLWETDSGDSYPFAPGSTPEVDDGKFVDPEPLEAGDVPGNKVVLSDGRWAGDCEIVEMPPRTSMAQFRFVFGGADAGSGYGRGGLSSAGMMPGFGSTLPPDYIQEVVDYVRGL